LYPPVAYGGHYVKPHEMMSLKRYSRLAAVAVLGVIALCLTTGGLYLLRSELLSRGYEVLLATM
jgi:hypothetical protein